MGHLLYLARIVVMDHVSSSSTPILRYISSHTFRAKRPDKSPLRFSHTPKNSGAVSAVAFSPDASGAIGSRTNSNPRFNGWSPQEPVPTSKRIAQGRNRRRRARPCGPPVKSKLPSDDQRLTRVEASEQEGSLTASDPEHVNRTEPGQSSPAIVSSTSKAAARARVSVAMSSET